MDDVHVYAACGKKAEDNPSITLWCQLTNFPFLFVAHVGNNPSSNEIYTKKKSVCVWLCWIHQDLP
jgi:hypothetical protein